VVNADPKLPYIPTSFINFGLRQGCGVFLELLQNKSVKLDPEYEQLLLDKPEFYDEIRKKMIGEKLESDQKSKL